MNTKTKTIQVRELVKNFGDFTAVNKVSFSVNGGEIFGFLGPNGSGKTTTIRMMLGLLQPTAGEIEVLGIPVNGQTREILPRIGYMSQKFSLYNDLTVLQNLLFYGQAYGIEPTDMNEKIHSAVSLAGLEGYESTPTKDLSGGWRQRLALSAAILHSPEVIFLDEPTAGVDPVSRRAFWDLLYTLVSDGITVFITTHYMDEAEHCHNLAFIQHGEIIAQGSPSSIKDQMMPGEVLEINTPHPEQLILALRNKEGTGKFKPVEAELYGSLIHVFAPENKPIIAEIKNTAKAAGIKIDSIASVEPSLEDVFIACMRDS
ncbi:MAG: ABC transporter ATP-binding protein [Anaerolineales bacterium]|nr:ABC transporter ATP-binding protein [Anaerolineales bacterium]